MKTIYASLPFYNSESKQDKVRTSSVIPVHCPKEELPPFLIKLTTDTVATITSIKLVSCTGVETDITSGYFSSFPSAIASTATAMGTYIQYNGGALAQNLPLGSYYLKLTKSDATYYSDWISVHNMSSPMEKFCTIVFSNTDNIGDLRYEGSFAQKVWLDAVLNNPTHEIIATGEERDGIFIAEKMVSKYIHSIITYVPKGIYRCLVRLSQHDSITITDELGDTYTPDVGNITIDPPEWVEFGIARIVIRFNDNENTAFGWVTY